MADDFERMWADLVPVGRAASDGYFRQPFTSAERECQVWFVEQCRARGLRVEVDQVHPLGAVGLPLQGGVERVAVRRLAARLALDETHGLAVGDVDGGEQLQDRHGRQRRSRVREAPDVECRGIR